MVCEVIVILQRRCQRGGEEEGWLYAVHESDSASTYCGGELRLQLGAMVYLCQVGIGR